MFKKSEEIVHKILGKHVKQDKSSKQKVTFKCPECSGSGRDENLYKCKACDGTGKQYTDRWGLERFLSGK